MPDLFREAGHILLHTLPEFARLLPFLFLTYLFIEWFEGAAGVKARYLIAKSGRFGPLLGSVLGILPQCGFSAAAAGLYARRVLSLGTLYAVFLATSDEMLPILLSRAGEVGARNILLLLLTKLLLGALLGILTDLLLSFMKKRKESGAASTEPLLENGSCRCGCCGGGARGKGALPILFAALRHTLIIGGYLLAAMLALTAVMHAVGEEVLSGFLARSGIFSYLLASLIGLIPNCAASVIVTELWLSGAISAGAMLSGLLTGAGVGVLVLFRSNRPMRDNFIIVALLYLFGASSGILLDLLGFSSLVAL